MFDITGRFTPWSNLQVYEKICTGLFIAPLIAKRRKTENNPDAYFMAMKLDNLLWFSQQMKYYTAAKGMIYSYTHQHD